MEYTYYPGCSLTSSSRSYDESLRKVFRLLDLGLVELEDWNCCGATMYMSFDGPTASSISARNLALAERLGHDVVAPCNSCYTVLSKTHRLMQENREIREHVNASLEAGGLKYNLSLRIRHPLDVLTNDVGIGIIKSRVTRWLTGLHIANYYGCQVVRPECGFDDMENPTTMDNLFEALGATNVRFPMKVRCCGGMLMTTHPELALKLVKEILECAQDNGAECIATTCPLCQLNLEAYQKKINNAFRTRFAMPVLFFTQLLGYTLGAEPSELGLQRHLVQFKGRLHELEAA